jgi:SAM-dependent methyltransferase
VTAREAADDQAEFDRFADRYDEALQRGLAVSGEAKEYYAQGRARWVRHRLAALRHAPGRIVDFGCGTGSGTPYLLDVLGATALLGVDVSTSSLDVARRDHPDPRASFATLDEAAGARDLDTAFCNGVFHHIPVADRAAAVAWVHRALRPGGIFAFWENNPWNPGTRYIMSRVEFDRDAITLSPPESRRLLRAGGFEVLRTDSLFWFPRLLAPLRVLEPLLAGVPLGGQYLVLCRRR